MRLKVLLCALLMMALASEADITTKDDEPINLLENADESKTINYPGEVVSDEYDNENVDDGDDVDKAEKHQPMVPNDAKPSPWWSARRRAVSRRRVFVASTRRRTSRSWRRNRRVSRRRQEPIVTAAPTRQPATLPSYQINRSLRTNRYGRVPNQNTYRHRSTGSRSKAIYEGEYDEPSP